MNILKIVLKSKNISSCRNVFLNKSNFICIQKDYYKNLLRYNYNIHNISLYQSLDNNVFLSEIELDISNETDDVLERLKSDDNFNLLKKKYYTESISSFSFDLEVNYFKREIFPYHINDDIFLL